MHVRVDNFLVFRCLTVYVSVRVLTFMTFEADNLT